MKVRLKAYATVTYDCIVEMTEEQYHTARRLEDTENLLTNRFCNIWIDELAGSDIGDWYLACVRPSP